MRPSVTATLFLGLALPGGCGQASGSHAGEMDAGVVVAAPRLLAPRSLGVFAGLRPTFRWTAVPGVSASQIEICHDSGCTAVITQGTVSGTVFTPTIDLPPGVVFWRVTALAGGTSSRESTVWALVLPHRDGGTPGSRGTMVDLNADGRADLVVAIETPSTVVLSALLGRAGFFDHATQTVDESTTVVTSPGLAPARIATLGDTDGDGRADLALLSVTDAAPDVGRVALSWVSIDNRDFVSQGTQGGWQDAVSAGDLDGDGYGDVLFVAATPGVARGGAMPLPYALGESFAETYGTGGATASAYIAGRPGDYNGDGVPDIALAPGATDAVYIHPGRVDGGLPGVVPSAEIHRLRGAASVGSDVAAPADINGDGYEDLVVAPLSAAVRQVEVFLGGSLGVDTVVDNLLTVPPRPGIDPGTEAIVFVTGVGDVNGDGFPDVATLTAVGNIADRVVVLGGSALGLMATPLDAVTANELGATGIPDVTGVGDLDGDGVDDLAVATTGDGQPGTLHVLRGGSTLTPTVTVTVSPAASPVLPLALVHGE